MAVVKADAYGHGAGRVAAALQGAGIRRFAVATLDEGIRLRQSGIEDPILVFAAPLPEQLHVYPANDLDVIVSSPAVAHEIVARPAAGRRFRAHVKVDTGMGRIGLKPHEVEDVIALLDRAQHVDIEGLWTHFATADEQDLQFAYRQLEAFDDIVRRYGDAARFVHTANSPAALRIPESYAYERSLIRAGIGLYGYVAPTELAREAGLRPVMTLTSRVTHLACVDSGTSVSYGRRWTAKARTRIATVGAGYADGYPRPLTNRADVVIQGRRHRVAGTICMDMFMVDVGEGDDVRVGDEVVLFGDPARHPAAPDAVEIGNLLGTIAYEILTGIAPRVPRVYLTPRSEPHA